MYLCFSSSEDGDDDCSVPAAVFVFRFTCQRSIFTFCMPVISSFDELVDLRACRRIYFVCVLEVVCLSVPPKNILHVSFASKSKHCDYSGNLGVMRA